MDVRLNSYALDLNKGFPLNDMLNNVGISFGGRLEIAAYDYQYNFSGIKYRSTFTRLEECGGYVSGFNIDYYHSDLAAYIETADLNWEDREMTPIDLYKIIKKGDAKATKQLLKGDDSFFELDRANHIINGFNGNDYFNLHDASGVTAIGGKGEDYFSLSNAWDAIIEGGKHADIFNIGYGNRINDIVITDFRKGKDMLVAVNDERYWNVQVIDNDTVLVDPDGSGRVTLEDVTGLTWKEQMIPNYEGEVSLGWYLN